MFVFKVIEIARGKTGKGKKGEKERKNRKAHREGHIDTKTHKLRLPQLSRSLSKPLSLLHIHADTHTHAHTARLVK